MGLPNIRLNVNVPFPARVQGSGVVKLTKSNGVWTVGLDYTRVANFVPPPGQYASAYFLLWNATTGIFTTISLAQALSIPQIAILPTAITVANSPYQVVLADTVIYVDTSGGPVVINLQPEDDRAGVSLTIKDVTGHAATNNISVVADGDELTDGFGTYPINSDFGGIRINPLTGIGYTVAP